MSPAVLEAERRGARAEGADQAPLFEDLRREPPVHRPCEGDTEERAPAAGPAQARGEPHPRSGGDRLTLEAHLERIWEGLIAAGAAECPVCGDRLEWGESSGSCRGCGSALH